jgi:hypothetical protein
MKTNRTPKWLIVLIVVISIIITIGPFVLFFFAIVSDTSSKFKIETNGTVSIANNKLTILSDVVGNYNEEDDCYYIEGTVKNNTKQNRNVSITYNVYDKDNVILGTADAYLDNLDSKGKWKFRASYCDYAKEVNSYKIVSVWTDEN